MIESGGTSTVTFSVKKRDLSYWDVAAQEWALSSRDLRLSATQSLLGTNATTSSKAKQNSNSTSNLGTTTSLGSRVDVPSGVWLGLSALLAFAFS